MHSRAGVSSKPRTSASRYGPVHTSVEFTDKDEPHSTTPRHDLRKQKISVRPVLRVRRGEYSQRRMQMDTCGPRGEGASGEGLTLRHTPCVCVRPPPHIDMAPAHRSHVHSLCISRWPGGVSLRVSLPLRRDAVFFDIYLYIYARERESATARRESDDTPNLKAATT